MEFNMLKHFICLAWQRANIVESAVVKNGGSST